MRRVLTQLDANRRPWPTLIAMRVGPIANIVILSSLLTLWPRGLLIAGESPSEQARRSAIALHVGPTEVTVGEIEDRLAAVPRFQLRAFGDTPDAIRHKFFDEVLL